MNSTDLKPGNVVILDGTLYLVEEAEVTVSLTLQRIEPLSDRLDDIMDGKPPEPFNPVFCQVEGKVGDACLSSPRLTILSPVEIV